MSTMERLLDTYKMRMVRIINLKHERSVFTNNKERIEEMNKEPKQLNFYQQKVKDGLVILNESERQIIHKRYMELDYIFKSMSRLAEDLNKCYSLIRCQYKSGISKLNNWNEGKGLY